MESSATTCFAPMPPRLAARRKQVADAARLLFAEHGFQNTRMAQIAAASGVKVGQIYRDFDSKEEIVADIVRADLARFLDEESLDRAIASGDPANVRRWISDCLEQDSDPTKGRLVAQIVVEAGRNDLISILFQLADRRIKRCFERALAAVAPGPERQVGRDGLIDIIMLVLLGLPQRRFAYPDTDTKAVAVKIGLLIGRELDRLIAEGTT